MAKAAKKATNGDPQIKVLKPNPRRKGTGAHRHFELAAKAKTRSAYLKRFKTDEDKKNASAYLSTNIREGFMKLVG